MVGSTTEAGRWSQLTAGKAPFPSELLMRKLCNGVIIWGYHGTSWLLVQKHSFTTAFDRHSHRQLIDACLAWNRSTLAAVEQTFELSALSCHHFLLCFLCLCKHAVDSMLLLQEWNCRFTRSHHWDAGTCSMECEHLRRMMRKPYLEWTIVLWRLCV